MPSNGILLTQHNQKIVRWSPDPFPRERVGSRYETRKGGGGGSNLMSQ